MRRRLEAEMFACCRIAVTLVLALIANAQSAQLEQPYVFTDEQAVVRVDNAAREVDYAIKVIHAGGWGAVSEGRAAVVDGKINIPVLEEGVHVVTLQVEPKPVEVRFLAMNPPPKVTRDRAEKALPRAAQKLFVGEPFTLLAMGDSVTHTGDYETLLKMMLHRATGNAKINVVSRAYAGRSIDATVRNFQADAIDQKPDVGLVMYGLNDQAGGVSLESFLEQYQWIADRLRTDCGAETVFLSPTPDASMGKDFTQYDPWLFRTIGFAESLRALAARTGTPYADTFRAIWGQGAGTLDATGRAMWPIFPTSYSKQFTSMIETGGKGDGIHPSVLGHLRIARATFDAMMGIDAPPQPLAMRAESAWTEHGLVAHAIVRNASSQRRSGRLEIYPVASDEIAPIAPQAYTLEPGGELRFEVSWPPVKKPEDLLKHPANEYAARGNAMFVAIDYQDSRSDIYAVTATSKAQMRFVRERMVVEGNQATVTLRDGDRVESINVPIATDGQQVGRVPLVRSVGAEGGPALWATAELAYVQYALADTGEATLDGVLDEWQTSRWVPVGGPAQARWYQGVVDHRTTPDECRLDWTFRKADAGIYLAAKVTGQIDQDAFVLFFDPRAPDQLGTPGRYYWLNGAVKPDGVLELKPGETSPAKTKPRGVWKSTPTGASIELFVPYELLATPNWPTSGDLGCSIWWRHKGTDGKTTNLFWSEDGHPWTPRWYGVVRLDNTKPAPFMVRVK